MGLNRYRGGGVNWEKTGAGIIFMRKLRRNDGQTKNYEGTLSLLA
jgi:hypothetical protein